MNQLSLDSSRDVLLCFIYEMFFKDFKNKYTLYAVNIFNNF